ncbi:MAG: Lrp/AsnC family transcriptional regulator [Candidatus Heimdallarchaeota archaeon]
MTLSFIFMKVKAGFVEHVIKKLLEMPEVKEAHGVTGGIDIIVKVEADDINMISKITLSRIHQIDGVERTATHIVVPL